MKLIHVAVIVTLSGVPLARADEAPRFPKQAELRAAVQSGLAIVQKAARNYPEHRSCFSCHHQTLPMLAMSVARQKGLAVDPTLLGTQASFTHASFEERVESMREGQGVGGGALTVGYGLWTLDIARWKRDQTTAAMVEYLLKKQRDNGSWKRSSNRPPLEESNFTATILAIYYMQKFATDGQKPRLQEATDRARSWLLSEKPESQEDLASRLGALPLVGAPAESIVAAREEILAAQRDDGGWAQLPGMESDAYATGFTLFALERVRLSTSAPAYRRGVRFLLETQLEDGSWFVKSRSKPLQKFFDNGDPHGKDQFISIPATSWATTALALAVQRTLRL